ncbi:MAG TPA: carbohydrate-binding protein [Candidatus Wallbacteria bacterium]|nr:carbohydrate-binding protein [Candidatus Wallbacteria bacterium]
MLININLNFLKVIVSTVLVLSFVAGPAASAFAASSNQTNAASVVFTYNASVKQYEHHIEGKALAGSKLRVVYDTCRKNILFKNSDTIYMRYSYDFWKSCQDVKLTKNSKGQYVGLVTLPPDVTTMQSAFFAAYPYDNYRSWGFIWDSNYGKNFSVNIISKKEIEQKEKFDMLCQNTK